MSGDIRNKLNVQTGGKENSESEGGKSKFGRGKPKRDIAAPFQPSPSVATPKVCPLTYRDRPPNRIDYISCHFPELDSGGDITFEKYVGPTPESNWVIPGKILVGAYPASQDDAETFELLTSILRLGITQFVCLQLEYKTEGITEAMWRRGQALRPYYEDVKLLIKNKHMFKVLTQESCVCNSDQLSFVHLPIKDCSVTDDGGVFQLALSLVESIHAGEIQYIHCWGGHGRTGTVVCIMLHLMYGMTANEAMEYCQTVHDLRQCPVAVGSPQTQSQRDQVTRIIGIAHEQERRYKESQAFKNMTGSTTTVSPSRFTFEGVAEGDECNEESHASSGNETGSSRGNKPRSESTDSCSSVPSHPVKKSSTNDDDADSTTSSTPDKQPQKYQAVEPNRSQKSVKKSSSSVEETSPPSNKGLTDFPAISGSSPSNSISSSGGVAATVASSANDCNDARDTVTPNIDHEGAVTDPHLDPADKSGSEHIRVVTETHTTVPTQPSPSSWFWQTNQQGSSSPAQPKPPKEGGQSSSSWKGSLKGLRKWSTDKFKSPPSTPTENSSLCSDADNSVNDTNSDATNVEIDKPEAAGVGPMSKSISFNGAAGSSAGGDDAQLRVPELVKSSSERDKSRAPVRTGRKWTLPNPLKKNSGQPSAAAQTSSPAVGPTVNAKGMQFTPR